MSELDFEVKCRRAFDADKTARYEELIVEFKAMASVPRVLMWRDLTSSWVTLDLEFIKFIHRHFGQLVLDAFRDDPANCHEAIEKSYAEWKQRESQKEKVT